MSVELIDKQTIAKSFGRAASSYDSVAHFQRWVGQQLLNKIPLNDAQSTVDLGCGTGYFAPDLRQRYANSQYLGIDLSEQMVRFASNSNINNNERISWIMGDAENLPLKTASIDLIFSSLSIQWCGDLSALFNEINRVLTEDGIFVFSTLVEGSLTELKQAWSKVDGVQHVNTFAQQSDYKEAILASGLRTKSLEIVEKVLHYQKVNELTRELKMLGAHNISSHRSLHLTGKQRIQKFFTAYEGFRLEDGSLPASYQVLFGVLAKEELSE